MATGCRWCAPAPSLWVCSVPFLYAFCPLSRFPFLLCLSNMPLFSVLRGFLARFGVRMYICMGLGFCVDCGAFVRVRCLAVIWLVACLPLFFPFFIFFAYLLGLCLCCPWLVLLVAWLLLLVLSSLSLWVVVVSFSLSDYAQKERARRVGASSLVLLWVVC